MHQGKKGDARTLRGYTLGEHSQLHSAKITVLGYGGAAREHALGLRQNGNEVSIGLRLGGMSWVRARQDGFDAQAPTVLIRDADVVVVIVPDAEQASLFHHAIDPLLAPGALLVFVRGLALATRVIEPQRNDVVLVTGDPRSEGARCRVAVHHDASGHALERAVAYAHAVFGAHATVGTTTVAAEVDAEVAALSERAGSRDALLETLEELTSRARDSHAPDEAKLAFYQGLRDLVAHLVAHPPASSVPRVAERDSDTSLFWPGTGGRA